MKKSRILISFLFVLEFVFILFSFIIGSMGDPYFILDLLLPFSYDSLPFIILILMMPFSLCSFYINLKLITKKNRIFTLTDNFISQSNKEENLYKLKPFYLFQAILQLGLLFFTLYDEYNRSNELELFAIIAFCILTGLSIVIIIDYENGALEY